MSSFPKSESDYQFPPWAGLPALPFGMPMHFGKAEREGTARPAVRQARDNWVEAVKTGRNRPLVGGRNRFSRLEPARSDARQLLRVCRTGRRKNQQTRDSGQMQRACPSKSAKGSTLVKAVAPASQSTQKYCLLFFVFSRRNQIRFRRAGFFPTAQVASRKRRSNKVWHQHCPSSSPPYKRESPPLIGGLSNITTRLTHAVAVRHLYLDEDHLFVSASSPPCSKDQRGCLRDHRH